MYALYAAQLSERATIRFVESQVQDVESKEIVLKKVSLWLLLEFYQKSLRELLQQLKGNSQVLLSYAKESFLHDQYAKLMSVFGVLELTNYSVRGEIIDQFEEHKASAANARELEERAKELEQKTKEMIQSKLEGSIEKMQEEIERKKAEQERQKREEFDQKQFQFRLSRIIENSRRSSIRRVYEGVIAPQARTAPEEEKLLPHKNFEF